MKCLDLIKLGDGRRKAFVESPMRTDAIKKCPWAQYLVKNTHGWWCFENRQDYLRHKLDDIISKY
jgi:hypothetical protein